MRRLLGFSGGFATTKGQEVEDNRKSAARGVAAKNKARKYRQYMNRKGGFNRPLDKMN
jgi:U4/U6.U5 tri-snRNP-associated protein 3